MPTLNSTQKIWASVERREVLIDRGWNTFKTAMVYVGGVCILILLLVCGYWLGGGFGCNTCTPNTPPTAAIVSYSQPSTSRTPQSDPAPPTVQLPVAVLSPAPAQPTNATPAVPIPPPAAHISVEVPPLRGDFTVKVKGLPASTPTATTVPAPPKPCPSYTDAEERRKCEIWVERQ